MIEKNRLVELAAVKVMPNKQWYVYGTPYVLAIFPTAVFKGADITPHTTMWKEVKSLSFTALDRASLISSIDTGRDGLLCFISGDVVFIQLQKSFQYVKE